MKPQHTDILTRNNLPNKARSYILIQAAEIKLLVHKIAQTRIKFMAHLKQYPPDGILKNEWANFS
jgi:hypothetical protein